MRGLTLCPTGQPMRPTIWVLPVMVGWVTLGDSLIADTRSLFILTALDVNGHGRRALDLQVGAQRV